MSSSNSAKAAGKKSSTTGAAIGGGGRRIVVRQVRSISGQEKWTKDAMRSLGLGRIGKSREFVVNPALAGIVRKVSHLIELDEVK
jgi:large subunit ribosomal protein L30